MEHGGLLSTLCKDYFSASEYRFMLRLIPVPDESRDSEGKD